MAATALIIDDDPVTIALLRRHLIHRGWEVMTAENGTIGLNIALREKPDLLITDMLLPGTHGVEICRRVRSHPELRDTRVLMMSGVYLKATDLAGDLECERDGFLIKPLDPARLDRTLADLSLTGWTLPMSS